MWTFGAIIIVILHNRYLRRFNFIFNFDFIEKHKRSSFVLNNPYEIATFSRVQPPSPQTHSERRRRGRQKCPGRTLKGVVLSKLYDRIWNKIKYEKKNSNIKWWWWKSSLCPFVPRTRWKQVCLMSKKEINHFSNQTIPSKGPVYRYSLLLIKLSVHYLRFFCVFNRNRLHLSGIHFTLLIKTKRTDTYCKTHILRDPRERNLPIIFYTYII